MSITTLSYDLPEDGIPSSDTELMHDQASQLGRDRPQNAWVLTSYDIWVANPYYQGPPQPHPEDY